METKQWAGRDTAVSLLAGGLVAAGLGGIIVLARDQANYSGAWLVVGWAAVACGVAMLFVALVAVGVRIALDEAD